MCPQDANKTYTRAASAWEASMGLFDADKSASRLPVSLITGFLGSGKTTLLNKLLRHDGMADSAVIINEFGEVGLDHLLVEAINGEVAVLASGCVCCTLRSDLEETLRNLLIKRDHGEVPAFSRILVETTGLADPAPIVQLLLNNPLVSHYLRLDAVATTVDAVNGRRQIDEHAEAVKQAALADRLLLTKTDLAAADAIAELDRKLDALNPGATRHAVLNGEIAPGDLFGAALFDPGRKTADVRRWINESAYQARPHDHHAHDGHADNRHAHDHAQHADAGGIRSCCLISDQPLSWDAVSSWLARLRKGAGEDLLRVKGILNLIGEDAPVAIHGVHHIFHSPVQLEAWPDADRRSRIVFITRGIEPAELQASFVEHVGVARV
jgi:G3E family GTPase